jgi:hypothetical protein
MSQEPGQHPVPSAGTWEEWLLLRPFPEPPPGETGVDIRQADFVASALSRGGADVLDFGFAPIRDGLRDLFAEFEDATKGRRVELAHPDRGAAQVHVHAGPGTPGTVRLFMSQEGGPTIATDFPPLLAMQLVESLVEAIKGATGEPEA